MELPVAVEISLRDRWLGVALWPPPFARSSAKRHGPYFELTYKANGKTVNVKLSPEAAPLYGAAAQQYRKLKTLLKRLDKLSKTILRHQAKLAESKRQD